MTTMTLTALPTNVSLTETVGPATMTNFFFNPAMQFRNTTGGVTMPYVQDQLVSCNFNIIFFATIAALFGFVLGAFMAGCANTWLRADMELERLKDAVEENRRSIDSAADTQKEATSRMDQRLGELETRVEDVEHRLDDARRIQRPFVPHGVFHNAAGL